jgi:uncharacterized surface protein with fasciclin (FAS1) repeats
MPFPVAGGSLGGPVIDPVLAPNLANAPIVDGLVRADALRPGLALRSRSGGAIEMVAESGGQLALRPGRGGFSVGARPADAPIVQPDIPCATGVIHKIDHVLVR